MRAFSLLVVAEMRAFSLLSGGYSEGRGNARIFTASGRGNARTFTA